MKGDWRFCLPEPTAKEIISRLDPKTRDFIGSVVDIFTGRTDPDARQNKAKENA